MDYRGIVLAEPAGDGHTSIDRYVAAFTVIDKNHPDILYVLTMPIIDTNSMTSYLDILPNGTFTFETSDPPEIGVKGSVLIDILQNPSTVGRRMVISIRISETASNYNDVELTPDNKRLAEAIQNGSILTGSLDIRLTLRNLHIPHDLHP